MTLRDDLLPVVDVIRGVAGDLALDQRTTQITVRTRVWSGGKVKLGNKTDTNLVLPQRYTCRIMSAGQAERTFGSGGVYTPGQWVYAAVTPPFPANPPFTAGSGYTLAQLLPDATDLATEIHYVLSSNGRPSGIDGVFRRAGVQTHRAYRIILFLERTNQSP